MLEFAGSSVSGNVIFPDTLMVSTKRINHKS